MEEIVDILDEVTGEKIGKTISKEEAHKKGIWHGSIHIIILDKDKNNILLQKRCKQKKLYPDMWDISVGGHISSGEEPIVSAKRELEEELGLDSKKYDFQFIKKIKEEFYSNGIDSKEFVYIYLIEEDVNIESITLQNEEVSGVKWFSKKEFYKLIETDKIINHKEEFDLLKKIFN